MLYLRSTIPAADFQQENSDVKGIIIIYILYLIYINTIVLPVGLLYDPTFVIQYGRQVGAYRKNIRSKLVCSRFIIKCIPWQCLEDYRRTPQALPTTFDSNSIKYVLPTYTCHKTIYRPPKTSYRGGGDDLSLRVLLCHDYRNHIDNNIDFYNNT